MKNHKEEANGLPNRLPVLVDGGAGGSQPQHLSRFWQTVGLV